MYNIQNGSCDSCHGIDGLECVIHITERSKERKGLGADSLSEVKVWASLPYRRSESRCETTHDWLFGGHLTRTHGKDDPAVELMTTASHIGWNDRPVIGWPCGVCCGNENGCPSQMPESGACHRYK